MSNSVMDISFEDDYHFLFSSGLERLSESTLYDEEELIELLWQNGEFVMNQINGNPNIGGDAAMGRTEILPEVIPPSRHLFMNLDDMTSWLMSSPTITGDQDYLMQPHQPVNNSSVLVKDLTSATTAVVGSNLTPATADLGIARVLPRATWDSGTSGTTSAELPPKPPVPGDRKRKTRDVEEDGEPEVNEAKKEVHGSSSTKKSRAAAVHNFSEKRRRGRINEKLKTLQELIPHSNKRDTVSLLDDVIEYLKTLKHMQQVMSVGYGMVPVTYPGIYMPSLTTGTNLVRAANQPIMPYPLQILASSEHLAPESLNSTFHQPIAQPANPSDAMFNLQQLQVPIQPRMLHSHLFQPYLGVHHSQLVLPQDQAAIQQSSSEPISFGEKNQNRDDIHYSG